MTAVQETKKQPVLLESLQSSYMLLCSAISKMDRKTYCRLIRSSRSMLNFLESHRSTIKPNLLSDEILIFEYYGMCISSGFFRYEETEEPFEEQDLSNAFAHLFNSEDKKEDEDEEEEEEPEKRLEFIYKKKMNSKKKCTRIPREEVVQMLKESRPKRVIWNCYSEEFSLPLLKDLQILPGCPLEIAYKSMESMVRIMNAVKPTFLLLKGFSSVREGRDMCDHLEHQIFRTIDSLVIEYFNFAVRPNHLQDLEEDVRFHFGGLLEHLKVFEVTTIFEETDEFQYKELQNALSNWCAGKNRLERISIRSLEQNDIFLMRQDDPHRAKTMRALYRENVDPIWVPDLSTIVSTVNSLSVSFHQLPQIMKEAIQNDQFTFGRTTKDEDEMNIRLLLCPSKKKMAYVYTSAWGEFAFRSFDFYPTKK